RETRGGTPPDADVSRLRGALAAATRRVSSQQKKIAELQRAVEDLAVDGKRKVRRPWRISARPLCDGRSAATRMKCCAKPTLAYTNYLSC
ncbi:MAG: hypothetical protein ACK40L_19635, partial [Hydrogenophaga sp.]